jgi:hypothetical protein
MSKPQSKTTFDFIMYRLDAIEKRLDSVEKHMHTRSENPDIIKVLLELIKNGPGSNANACAVAATTAIVDAVVTKQAQSHVDDTNYDNLTMVRRRTLV